MTKINKMEFKQLLSYSPNYGITAAELPIIVKPKRSILSKSNREVYTKGVLAQVIITKPRGSEWFQIYRDTGHHVLGNSQKRYDTIDLILEDFDIIESKRVYRNISELEEDMRP